MRARHLLAPALLAVGTLLGPAAEPVAAQFTGYFGRNKVQYQHFNFQVLKTEHFDVHYYDEEREAAVLAARMAERWYARLSRVLNHEFRKRQPIILYANHPNFTQTNATPGQIGEGTGGFTEILKRRVVLPLAGPLGESDHVLGHELVHAFQFDITGQGTGGPGIDVPGAIRLPLWFIEGMAEYLSIGPLDPFTSMWLRDAVASDDLPTIADLRNPKYFPYRYGHALWSFIAGRWGEQRLARILRLAGRTGNGPGAIAAVLEIPVDELSAMWHEALKEYYAPVLAATEAPETFGRKLLTKETTGGNLNLGPALSPDGSQVMFLSERGLFAVDMYLADARTGRIRQKVTSSALDPHFESLQYINSSGSWSPDGQQFVFAGVSKGRPVITLIALPSGDKVREYKLRDLGEIFAPAWSPDGDRIAFSAQVGGLLDLYVLELSSGEVTRLTNDAYADFQPTWSPDGRSLAFVTDRFGTDLNLLVAGRYELAQLDLTGVTRGQISELPNPPDGDSWDPHWAPDGESIYFVSDYAGMRNVHRLSLSDDRIYRVTNLKTGVSGIANLSPALSVARSTGTLAVSVYQEGPFNYDTYLIESPEVLAGTPEVDQIADVDPAVVPPRERFSEELITLQRNPRLGLADPITFEETDYSAGLSLDFIGQPTLALAASDFGVFFAGGASLFFSDLLGDINLSTLLQINSETGGLVNGTAAVVGYENRKSRWNWGLAGGQIPFLSRFFQSSVVQQGGQDFLLLDDFRFFQINRQALAAFSYPLNRSQRVEFGLQATLVDFNFERKQVLFDRFGQRVAQQTVDAPGCTSSEEFEQGAFCSPSSLFTGGASVALVFDNSIFGGTSPIAGQRYRLELTPTAGSLNYLTVLADYRKYFLLARPLNLAGRVLHFGRYFNDGEDPRLADLFVGFPQLVRGYDFDTFTLNECISPGGQAVATCPVFDQLLGSRIAVANVELRLPLLGGIGVVPATGFPPIEIGAFFDAGVAYTSDLDPCFDSTGPDDCREPVKSVGFLSRINVFGLLIAEIDVVNPLDRPNKDWFVQFSLQPGF
ncbi:MAG: peptidase S9 [Gemmatimonadota bacterium]